MRLAAMVVALALPLASCEESKPSAGNPNAPVAVITEASFEADVLKAQTPVLVDFWASWCGPCQMVAPTVEELAAEYEGRVKVGKVDVDANGRLAQKYGISAIPALLVFQGGEVKQKFIGVTGKSELAAALESALK